MLVEISNSTEEYNMKNTDLTLLRGGLGEQFQGVYDINRVRFAQRSYLFPQHLGHLSMSINIYLLYSFYLLLSKNPLYKHVRSICLNTHHGKSSIIWALSDLFSITKLKSSESTEVAGIGWFLL